MKIPPPLYPRLPLKGPSQESLKYLAKREHEFGLLLPLCILIVVVAFSFGLMLLFEGRWEVAVAIFLGCAALMALAIVLVAGPRR